MRRRLRRIALTNIAEGARLRSGYDVTVAGEAASRGPLAPPQRWAAELP
jgi:hypothetical protein